MQLTSMRAIAFASLAALSLAACGGGSSTLPAPRASASPVATSTPVSTLPSPAAGSSTSTIAVGSTPVTQTIPAVSGISTTIALPAQSQAATIDVVTTTGSATGLSAAARHRFVSTALPQGPYYITTSFTPDRTIAASGAGTVTYDIGGLLASTSAGSSISAQLALIAAYLAVPGAPQPYIGLLDPSGNFSVIGPIQFNGTTLRATLPSNLTIVAGTTYQVGLHFGPLTPVVIATPSPAPTPTPTVTPTSVATVSPTPVATSSPTSQPTLAPTATPMPTPMPTPTPVPTATATPTPHATTQTIDAAGHADTDANAFAFGSVGPYGASIGYPANNSNVVTASTTAYAGLAPGAPTPSSGTVVYSVTTSLAGGPPSNQSSIAFTAASNGVVQGVITVPATSTSTYTINAYVPAYYGNMPIYSATGLTQTNGQITFSSPFSAGSTVTLPTNTTIYFELSKS